MADASAPRLTSPQKILWPAVEATKADLWHYLERVAERMLPQVAGRPLSLVRRPNGVEAAGFLQKNLPDSAPAWLPRHKQWTPTSDRTVTYALAERADDLRWMANQAAVELHEMLVRADRDDRPDLLVFDLDPGEQGPRAPQAAHWMREVLDELGLEAAIKTSGKRGLHLVVPIDRRYGFPEARAFGLAASRACADRHPDALTVAMRKADRNGRLLLDWSRNGAAQTMIAPWSPRVTPTATVSMPLRWDEVTDDLDPSAFTIASALQRPDPWEDLPSPNRLERASAALARTGYELIDASPRGRVRDDGPKRPER